MQLADTLVEQFFDNEGGGFFFTSHHHETLLQRRKDFTDDSLPSGNGVAALALLKLGHLTGRQDYLDAAERTLKTGWSTLERMPHACTALLMALLEYDRPRQVIILRGEEETITDWQQRIEPLPDVRSLSFAIRRQKRTCRTCSMRKKPTRRQQRLSARAFSAWNRFPSWMSYGKLSSYKESPGATLCLLDSRFHGNDRRGRNDNGGNAVTPGLTRNPVKYVSPEHAPVWC